MEPQVYGSFAAFAAMLVAELSIVLQRVIGKFEYLQQRLGFRVRCMYDMKKGFMG